MPEAMCFGLFYAVPVMAPLGWWCGCEAEWDGRWLEVRGVLCSKGRVFCWKGKFCRPLSMSDFYNYLCIRCLLIWEVFEG